MSRVRIRFIGLIAAAALGWPTFCAGAAAAQDSAQQKADAQQAKAIAKEAEALVKAKKFPEARAKYIEVLRLDNSTEYTAKLARVDAEIDGIIKKKLQAAESHFAAGKYQEAIARLDETRLLREDDPAVLYNRALIAYKLGDKPAAVATLDRAVDTVGSGPERVRLLQLKTQWETGEQAHAPAAGTEQVVKDLNDALANADDVSDACTKMRALAGGVRRTPSLVFNLAKCAEEEGKLEEASRLLDEYLTLAPDATDRQATQSNLDEARDLELAFGVDLLELQSEDLGRPADRR